MSDEFHSVEIEFDPGYGVSVRFKCDAPEGSGCRMVPSCFLPGGTCAENEGYHLVEMFGEGLVCTGREDRVDGGECCAKSWIDIEPDIMGSGTITLPVTTEWTGEDWSFILPELSHYQYAAWGAGVVRRAAVLTPRGEGE